ncbi:hypothetical protein DRJ48_03975 [Candidatus Woesearchaeota archaeon]|nr:hypothetical protein [Candidatus Woesearchaeota archaeon]RLE42213.1 MAG: hypothetical protein DRJ48_03975 [Candidatus Woesearchaeota archaeon]
MDEQNYEDFTKEELITIIKDYEKRFQAIRGLLYYEYGYVSSDDLLGFIDRLIPKGIKARKLGEE